MCGQAEQPPLSTRVFSARLQDDFNDWYTEHRGASADGEEEEGDDPSKVLQDAARVLFEGWLQTEGSVLT
jgi:hypothetical protein